MARSQVGCSNCDATIQVDEDRLDEEMRAHFWRFEPSMTGQLEYVCLACRLEDVEHRLRGVEDAGSDQNRAIDRLERTRR
jgi:hypothetical protein